MPHRVLLAEDHAIFRECLRDYLLREGFEIVAEATDGQEAIDLAGKHSPDVAVLDLGMPVLNGLDAARQIVRASSRTKIVLLTMHSDDHYVLEALRAGVKGYVLKRQLASDLAQAIREVLRGRMYLSPQISNAVVDAYLGKKEHQADPLTARERQVLQLIAEGKTTKEVAVILGVSTKTADSHRSRLMQKLDIHEIASLVRYAIRRGMIQP